METKNLVFGTTYKCKLKHCVSGKIVEADLVWVDEDDCNWRTADDNSEINEMAWDVVEVSERYGN